MKNWITGNSLGNVWTKLPEVTRRCLRKRHIRTKIEFHLYVWRSLSLHYKTAVVTGPIKVYWQWILVEEWIILKSSHCVLGSGWNNNKVEAYDSLKNGRLIRSLGRLVLLFPLLPKNTILGNIILMCDYIKEEMTGIKLWQNGKGERKIRIKYTCSFHIISMRKTAYPTPRKCGTTLLGLRGLNPTTHYIDDRKKQK